MLDHLIDPDVDHHGEAVERLLEDIPNDKDLREAIIDRVLDGAPDKIADALHALLCHNDQLAVLTLNAALDSASREECDARAVIKREEADELRSEHAHWSMEL